MLKMCGNSGVCQNNKYTLPKAQRTQGIEYFDSINTFSSKQKFQEVLKSWSNVSVILFDNGKGREKCK